MMERSKCEAQFEHLGSIRRKYIHFGLNLGRNGTRLQRNLKTLNIWFTGHGDVVTISHDDINSRDDVRILIDDVKLTDSEEARRRFRG
ncbi:hypothetical protein Tco_1496697 [Tanacetum coccineum]